MTATQETNVRAKTGSKRVKPAPARDVPPALIYEMWKGKPVYYKGYRDVLAGKKNMQEVMSCSDLQGVLVSLLNFALGNSIDRKKYILATNEIGIHLERNDNLANDIAIFEKSKLGKLKGKYFDIPPKVVIEVDIKADVTDIENGADGYVMQKSQKLLDFGVEKIFWIITSMQRIYVIDRNDPTWRIVDWSETIPVMDTCTLNVKQILDDEEILYV